MILAVLIHWDVWPSALAHDQLPSTNAIKLYYKGFRYSICKRIRSINSDHDQFWSQSSYFTPNIFQSSSRLPFLDGLLILFRINLDYLGNMGLRMLVLYLINIQSRLKICLGYVLIKLKKYFSGFIINIDRSMAKNKYIGFPFKSMLIFSPTSKLHIRDISSQP